MQGSTDLACRLAECLVLMNNSKLNDIHSCPATGGTTSQRSSNKLSISCENGTDSVVVGLHE